MQKYATLQWIALIGDGLVIFVLPKADTSENLFLAALAALPCTLIALWGAWEYKKTGQKQTLAFSATPFGAHPYLATATIVLINAVLLVGAIRLAIQGE